MNFMDMLLLIIAQRQPVGPDDIYFKVHRHGQVISVDCAYVRKGHTVSKNYHVTHTSAGVDIYLTTFSIG